MKHFVLVLLLTTTGAGAQESTAGTVADSLTLELASGRLPELNLPQITFTDKEEPGEGETNRTAFETALRSAGKEAWGLLIFNKITRCIEAWNGNTWIPLCSSLPKQQAENDED